jgi:DNA-binding XRE family transcriptional regulator
MDLIKWQKLERWSNHNMAHQLGITPQTLSKVRKKKQKPSMLLAKAIARFTNNEVTLVDLGIEEK